MVAFGGLGPDEEGQMGSLLDTRHVLYLGGDFK